jgi:hypothetical protein
MASITDTANIIFRMIFEGEQDADKAAQGIDAIKTSALALVTVAGALKAAKLTAELTMIGATADRQATALDNLATSAGTSGDAITGAIREASDFTIDRMDAMAAANRAMVMDVAQSPAEFERLTRVAVALGRAMGQDATKSIDDFVTASARQSQMIADNLGLTVTVGQATERYAAQLGIAADELTDAQKKQAFLNMMLEEGEKKMAELGKTTLDTAGKVEQASATWSTFISIVGQGFSDALLGSTVGLGGVNRALDEHGGLLSEAISFALQHSTSLGHLNMAMEMVNRSTDDTNVGLEAITRRYQGMERAQVGVARRTSEWSRVSDELRDKLEGQRVSTGVLEHTILNTADAIRREAIGSNDELMRTVLGATDALKQEAEAAALVPPALDGSIEAAERMMQSQLSLAASLKDATDAQIAQAAISQLGAALAEGDITLADYNTAVGQVQLTFGLATEESMKLSEGILGLTEDLASGELTATGYDEALLGLIGTTTDAATQTDQLAQELAALPSKKTIVVEYKRIYTGGGGGGGGGGSDDDVDDVDDDDNLPEGFSFGNRLLSNRLATTTTPALLAGGAVPGGVTIGPVTIVTNDPEVIWKKLEQLARLKNKSGWQQLGR